MQYNAIQRNAMQCNTMQYIQYNAIHTINAIQCNTINQQQVPAGKEGAVVQFRPATTRLAMVSSQSIVEKSLKMPVQVTANVTGGIFQMDADTAIPYTVLGEAHPGSRLFNFVVCHDLFDTCENAQIFFRPIVSKYPGMQVLVWNYPGQAFSEWYVFIVHGGSTRCVLSSTDNIMNRQARITLTVECIRTCIVILFFDVSIQGRV